MKITRLLMLLFACSLCQNVLAEDPETGWWWNADETGRGYAIERQGDTIFFSAFLYDNTSSPTWYTAILNRDTSQGFSGTLQQFQDGQTLFGSYQAPTTLDDNAGPIQLSFSNTNQGSLTWPGGEVALIRFKFAPNDSSSDDSNDHNPDIGWWWNTNESGRGFVIERQGDTIFFAAFLYDNSGLPTWYTAILNSDTQQGFSGVLQQFQGGQTLLGVYQPPTTLNDNAGPIMLSFSNDHHGTLTWPGGTVAISRFQFAADDSSDDSSSHSHDSSDDAHSDDSSDDSGSDSHDSSDDAHSDDSSDDSSHSHDSSDDDHSDDDSN